MRYTFVCPRDGEYDARADMDDIWAPCPECGIPGPRDLHADLLSQSIDTGDPFRRYHLSTAKERAQEKQQRYIGGPTDNFERKRLEKLHGRTYIGDSAESLRPISQKAIAHERIKP